VNDFLPGSECSSWLNLRNPRISARVSVLVAPTAKPPSCFSDVICLPAVLVRICGRDEPRDPRSVAWNRKPMEDPGGPHGALQTLYPTLRTRALIQVDEKGRVRTCFRWDEFGLVLDGTSPAACGRSGAASAAPRTAQAASVPKGVEGNFICPQCRGSMKCRQGNVKLPCRCAAFREFDRS
jgi:hypothetical protein